MSRWQSVPADSLERGDIVTINAETEAVKDIVQTASGTVLVKREGMRNARLSPGDLVEVYR